MRCAGRLLALLAGFVVAEEEVLLALPSGGQVALSTRGPSAFRVRFLSENKTPLPIETPMVGPDAADAPFSKATSGLGAGISTSFGSALLSPTGELLLLDAAGSVLTRSLPLAAGGDGVVSLATARGKLYGRGAGTRDASMLTALSASGSVTNREVYAPHYYSTDGYAALGVANETQLGAQPNGEAQSTLLAHYKSDGQHITWTHSGPFELYLMPAASLDLGTRAYFALTGMPRVPPRYVFGFIASRWGWPDKAHLESDLWSFRRGQFPIDAFICDFEFFTPVNDYAFPYEGVEGYRDFGFNPATFPNPSQQIEEYQSQLHLRMGAIRKPRMGNAETLNFVRSNGWTVNSTAYAGRYLQFDLPDVRDWYGQEIMPYLDTGIDFWWNDEGELDYFTYYWWNVAEKAALLKKSPKQRFFSLNRAWSPGNARLGAAVWTGDITPTWGTLAHVPGYVVNYGLAGAPYVACDIGGFMSGATPELLVRWYQVGVFMPIMRVHSIESAMPHFPWLWGEDNIPLFRRAMELRYQLIPYHYSLAHAMSLRGKLWMQPLEMAFPDDPAVYGPITQWLDGDSLLIAPVLREDSKREVYLPRGRWYAFNTSIIFEGPQVLGGVAPLAETPVFAQAGTLLPLAPVVQHTGALPGGPLEVQVYAGAAGAFELVEDDGESVGYESGEIRTTSLTWDDESSTLSWQVKGTTSSAQAFSHLSATLFFPGGVRRSAVRPLGASGSISFEDLTSDSVSFLSRRHSKAARDRRMQ